MFAMLVKSVLAIGLVTFSVALFSKPTLADEPFTWKGLLGRTSVQIIPALGSEVSCDRPTQLQYSLSSLTKTPSFESISDLFMPTGGGLISADRDHLMSSTISTLDCMFNLGPSARFWLSHDVAFAISIRFPLCSTSTCGDNEIFENDTDKKLVDAIAPNLLPVPSDFWNWAGEKIVEDFISKNGWDTYYKASSRAIEACGYDMSQRKNWQCLFELTQEAEISQMFAVLRSRDSWFSNKSPTFKIVSRLLSQLNLQQAAFNDFSKEVASVQNQMRKNEKQNLEQKSQSQNKIESLQ